MIKKTWILLLLVLALNVSAYGTLVDVVIDSYDDNDLSGDITPGDEVHIKIVSSVYISIIDFGLQVTGNSVSVNVGFAQPRVMEIPQDLTVTVQTPQARGDAVQPKRIRYKKFKR